MTKAAHTPTQEVPRYFSHGKIVRDIWTRTIATCENSEDAAYIVNAMNEYGINKTNLEGFRAIQDELIKALKAVAAHREYGNTYGSDMEQTYCGKLAQATLDKLGVA